MTQPLTVYAEQFDSLRGALEDAIARGYRLGKHADPTEPARTGMSVDEAADIAAEDPGLIYIIVISD